jgi:spermidine synthase
MRIDLVGLANECETGDGFEARVLETLRRAVGVDAALFMVRGHEQAATRLGLSDAAFAKLGARGATYAEELVPVKKVALAARGVAVDTEVCGVARVRRTQYFRDMASSVGGEHTLMAYVPWRGRIQAAVMLGRGGRGFSATDVGLMESLLPTLGLARATYGWPRATEPLPAAPARGVLERLGLVGEARVLASVSTSCGTVVVQERAGFREMVASEGSSTLVWTRVALSDSMRSGWPYIDLLHLAPALAARRARALFIGSGGAVGVRQFASAYPGMAIELVESEAVVVALAREWFGLGEIPGVTVHVADGCAFLKAATTGTWDVVVVDAYGASLGGNAFASDELTREVRRVLRPGGAVAWNVIGTLGGDGPVQELAAAARRVFETVRLVPVVDVDERYEAEALRNVVVVAVA